MKKKLIVRQDGYKECGAASLLSIIRYYNGNVSLSKLVELTNTSKDGTNFYNLKYASSQIGLDAIGYQVCDNNNLFAIKTPFICQIMDSGYDHFIVVYEVKKNRIICMDPARGVVNLEINSFLKVWTSYIMIFKPRKKLIFLKNRKYLNEIIMETIKNNFGMILNILLLSIIFTIFSCIFTFYFQIMYNNSISIFKSNYLLITFIFSIILIVKCLANFFRNELMIYLNQKIDLNIFMNTFKKLLLLPYNYYKNKTSGEMVSRINDLVYVKSIITKIMLTVFLDIIIFVVSGVMLLLINKIMFLFLLMIILIYIVIYYIFRPVLKEYTNINQVNNANVNSLLVETINGYETIKNINLFSVIYNKMSEFYLQALDDSFVYDNYLNLELFLKEIMSLIGLLLMEFVGFLFTINGGLDVGAFLTFIFISNFFIDSAKNIIDLNRDYYYAVNSIDRLNNLLDVDSDDLSTKESINILGNIDFHNLSFSYNDDDLVLSNVNFSVNVGDKVLIIGESGSGKSTLLKILQKYYDIGRKNIYLDGVDINDYSLNCIRNNISSISQNEILFTDTIYNNITLYRKVDKNEFLDVCRITKIDEFVDEMFLGYDTMLEENGLNLSGGQRQRIVLARMLLNKSKIMLIDEGLNAVDVNLERRILKEIFFKYKNNTVIIVSHRLENMDLFDKVTKLDNGKMSLSLFKPGGDVVC